jgi:uncharacterized protein YsxB (DUF464 family)
MTKAIADIDPLARSIMVDCQNHAEDINVCTIISTLCNVMVEAAFKLDKEPTIYNPGHVRIDIEDADDKTLYLFETVWGVMRQAAEQHPDDIKLY